MRFRRPAILGRDDDRGETPERRQAAEPALLGLLAIEPLGVARNQRRDDRMLRLPGLQKRAAELFAAARAAGRLAQELERALGGARIGIGEPDVGVDHANESEQREVVALGDELGADDEVVGAARRRPRAERAGSRSRRENRTTGRAVRMSGKSAAASSARRSTPGPQAVRVSASWHSGQSFGSALDMAAMVADEGRAEAVLDQPGSAIRALKAMPAGAAERQRGVAAPVEEEQRLLAAGPRLLDAGDRLGDSHRPRGGPSRRRSTVAISGSVAAPKRAGSLSQR